MIKQNISDHLFKEGHLPSNDQHAFDLNSSRENSITHSVPKPHVSSYQKFAVGVVEALVAGKKKQFPNLGKVTLFQGYNLMFDVVTILICFNPIQVCLNK